MHNQKILSRTALLLIVFWLHLVTPKVVLGQSPTITAEVDNTATIGVPTPTPTATPTPGATSTPTPTASPTATPTGFAKIKIFGWAPRESTVGLRGIAVSEDTQADITGYFEFTGLTLPTPLSFLAGLLYPELCLTAKDTQGRTTHPVCIPPLSLISHARNVGPILLPPTLSFTKGIVRENTQSQALGRTIPDSEVKVYLAKKDLKPGLNIVSEIAAFYLPTYSVKSNDQGDFEFSLPTNEVNDWRIFVAANFQGSLSAKSNTLTLAVKPGSYRIIELFEDTTRSFKPSLLALIIILELLILAVLIVLSVIQNNKLRLKEEIRKDIKRVHTTYGELQKQYEELIRRKKSRI